MPMLMMLSREVRRVPLDWKHPREGGGHVALFGSDFATEAAEWDAGRAAWDRGEYPDYASDENKSLTYEQWHGDRPEEADYMPTFPADAMLGICMYETVSEGSPISPVFPDSHEGRICLASFLAADASGAITEGMTDEQWMAIIDGGLGTKDLHTGEVEVTEPRP